MESIKLKKGEVHFMEDRLIIEGDDGGSLFSWGRVINLYLTDNNIRMLFFEKGEMRKFMLSIDQKMKF